MQTEPRNYSLPDFDAELAALDITSPYTARYTQPEESARFGELYVDKATGEMHSYASLIEPTVKAAAQLEANLTHYTNRARLRDMLADKIEREVVPVMPLPWIQKIPDKLRHARKTGTFGVHAMSGKGIVLWDDKASLSRLCPDDAREEASRLQKRYVPIIEQAWRDGCHVQYAVFTMPNYAQGQLRAGMDKMFNRLRDLLKRTDRDGNKVFPEIEGALAVLEAPMAWDRTWNVHLNVLLVVRGFCDYAKLRRLWHWNVEFKKLPSNDVEALRSSLRELIKYPVVAVSEKSERHGQHELPERGGPSCETEAAPAAPSSGTHAVAPPMLAWTGQELAEWLLAHHGFRRTRSYGCLYGAPKPEPASLDDFVWVGFVRRRNGEYRVSVRLLDSIPEDKSGVMSKLEAWQKYRQRLFPPPEQHAGAPALVDQPLENLVV